MAKENEGLNLGDAVSSVGAALGLIAAWLYIAGWTYAYAYFDRFRIPLLLVDIPFQHMLVYGGLVVLKNSLSSALIAALGDPRTSGVCRDGRSDWVSSFLSTRPLSAGLSLYSRWLLPAGSEQQGATSRQSAIATMRPIRDCA